MRSRTNEPNELVTIDRTSAVAAALRLEMVAIAWMTIEALAAIGAGIAARSLLLVAFGIDSGIELASGIVVFRRFRFESQGNFGGDRNAAKSIEQNIARGAGFLLLLLAAYVLVQSVFGLVTRHAAERSLVGIAVAIIAALGMPFLANAKLRIADRINSPALRADAMETLTCSYLSWILLVGLALNALTRWWWIDSVASLAIIPLLIREGWEAMSGEQC